MRISIGSIRSVVSEAFSEERYMSEDEAQKFILDMDGDEVTQEDIIDEETGEIYLKAGDAFNVSPWNPDHRIDKRRAENDEGYAHRVGVWDEYHGEDDDYWERLDREEEEGRERKHAEDAQAEEAYHAAVTEWAEGMRGLWADYSYGHPDLHPQDIAFDLADSFFHTHSEWKNWARVMRMTKQQFKESLADYAYDAMMKDYKDGQSA